jgi:hypothetical protein
MESKIMSSYKEVKESCDKLLSHVTSMVIKEGFTNLDYDTFAITKNTFALVDAINHFMEDVASLMISMDSKLDIVVAQQKKPE